MTYLLGRGLTDQITPVLMVLTRKQPKHETQIPLRPFNHRRTGYHCNNFNRTVMKFINPKDIILLWYAFEGLNVQSYRQNEVAESTISEYQWWRLLALHHMNPRLN